MTKPTSKPKRAPARANPHPIELPAWFTRDVIGSEQAAELLGVSVDHTHLLIRRKKIKAINLGKRNYAIYRPSLAYYLKTKSPTGRPSKSAQKI